MPTGYTAAVANGSITTLRQFALQCARGMGALVMMRDSPWDAPIPERFEPSQYHAERLAEVRANLADLRAMKPQEWQAAADAEHDERLSRKEEWLRDRTARRERYDAMIAKVSAWEGSPEGIKSFMLDQLREGRRFDCSDGDYYETVERKTGEDWKVGREQDLAKEAAYHAKEQQQENDRTESRNAWIAHLRASLDCGDLSPSTKDNADG